MTVALRYENSQWPLVRVLYADTFASDGSGPWTIAPYVTPPSDGNNTVNGITLDECTRQALPAIGEAVLRMEYGRIDGETVLALDLLRKHIRVQMAARRTDGEDPEWRTVWLGVCAWQDDTPSPAASSPRGTRLYRCYDILYHYANGYPMDRHANYACPSALAYGHPGYNYDKGNPTTVSGNKEATDSEFSGPDGNGIANFAIEDEAGPTHVKAWTDLQAAQNILAIRRNSGDPIFTIDCDPAGLLEGKTPWPMSDHATAWTALKAILDRKRGKGLAFLDWDDDVDTPDGVMALKIRVRPQLADDVDFTSPVDGAPVTIDGASQIEGQVISVDLAGDHRAVDGSLKVRDRSDSTFDELTTEGEQIEVAATGSIYDGSWVKRWSTALYTAWAAADPAVQAEDIYKPVLQRFGIARTLPAWKDGNNAATVSASRVDYWTNTIGNVINDHTAVTAAQDIEVMDDMPLYVGYDYSLTPPAPAASAELDGKPKRRKLTVYMRNADDRYETAGDWNSGGAEIGNDSDGTTVEWSGDEEGDRSMDTDDKYQQITFTVGLRLPQRPRVASAISGDVRTRRVIRISDLHLWIAHPGCIWDLDGSSENTDGCQGRRVGGTIGTVPGKLLRDDRLALASAHYLAWEWYRSDSPRASVVWSLRCCGLLPSYIDLAGDAVAYPTMGKIVGSMYAGGDVMNPLTPITRIDYDNTTGVTTWHTDWEELDSGAR